ncbi:MAG: hypothetical protein GX804_09665 [Lentisphaerae bacterium]|nr:hypothetical protein [Lentisphaerota bacterium]
MSVNPDIIIVVGSSSIAFFDTRSSSCQVASRSEILNTADTISAMFENLKARKSGTATVFSADFFTQKVRLGIAQVRGLAEADLLSVLEFEVEPFSNIPHGQGLIACSPDKQIENFSTWNVLHISKTEVAGISSVLRKQGIRLISAGYIDDSFPFGDEEEARTVLQEKLQEIKTGSPPFPLLITLRTGSVERRSIKVAVTATIFIAAACFCHFFFFNNRLSSLREESWKLDAIAFEIEDLNTGIRNCKSRIASIEAEKTGRARADQRLSLHRSALSTLFRILPDSCGDDVFIQSISPVNPFEHRLSAFSSESDGPYSCMDGLASALSGSGWTVMPEQASNMESAKSHGNANFMFRVSFSEDRVLKESP